MSHDGNLGAGLILQCALVLQCLPNDGDGGRKDRVASNLCHGIRGDGDLVGALSARPVPVCFVLGADFGRSFPASLRRS
jgi:hypothetical protein